MANQVGPKHQLSARIFHMTNLFCMILLILTGLHVNIPMISNFFGIHYFAGAIMILNLVQRFIFLFVGRHADIGTWGIGLGELGSVLKYYLFMGPHYNKKYKYNVLQTLAYIFIVCLIGFQGVTGWALAYPDGALHGVIMPLGGFAALRGIHIFLMYIFIAFTFIHAYMVAAYDPSDLAPMFKGTQKPAAKAAVKGKTISA